MCFLCGGRGEKPGETDGTNFNRIVCVCGSIILPGAQQFMREILTPFLELRTCEKQVIIVPAI